MTAMITRGGFAQFLSAAAALVALSPALSGAVAPGAAGQFPFKRDGKLMMVQVRINGSEPTWFVVDSGAPHTIFDPTFAQALGLKVESAPPTTGTGTGKVTKSVTGPATMALNDVKIDLAEPWVIDLSNVPISKEAKGLVGAELFEKFVVKIDPLESTFSVFDPASFQYTGGGASLPLIVEGGKFFLEANLEVPAGKTTTHKLRIDTGAESSVNDEIVKQSAELRSSILGGGLGESFKSYSGVFTSVKIGPYVLNHVWGPGGSPPLIGMELLRRFIITFDAPHGRMYLEPTPALSEPVPAPPEE
jgi:predicted aspartyl protease